MDIYSIPRMSVFFVRLAAHQSELIACMSASIHGSHRITLLIEIYKYMHACMRHLRKQYTTLHHDSRLGDAFIRDEQPCIRILDMD